MWMFDAHTAGCRDDYELWELYVSILLFYAQHLYPAIFNVREMIKKRIDGENTYANCFVMGVNICN